MKKFLFMLLLGLSSAHANTLHLDNGFIAQTDDVKWGVEGSGNTFYTGLFVPGAGDGSYTNPMVSLSNSNGTFSFNAIEAYSFYPFDPVELAIYNASGLVDHFKLANGYYTGRGVYDYNTDSWTRLDGGLSHFIFAKTYTDITHITLVSDFILGFSATLPTTVAAVPEPETYAMLGCGLLMLGALRRKKVAAIAA